MTATMTTREFAKVLKVTPRKLRRVLRTLNNDDTYTRYTLTPSQQKRIRKVLAA